jgi:hypothetical protein
VCLEQHVLSDCNNSSSGHTIGCCACINALFTELYVLFISTGSSSSAALCELPDEPSADEHGVIKIMVSCYLWFMQSECPRIACLCLCTSAVIAAASECTTIAWPVV